MNKYLLILILSLAVLGQTAFATPEPKEFEPPKPPAGIAAPRNPEMEKHRKEFNKRLNLTEEQKQKAKQSRIESQAKMKPLMDELISKQQERNRLENSDGNDKEIQTLNNEIKDLRQDLHNIILQNERDFMEILTPEQKTEFNKMREERKQVIQKQRMMKKNMKPHQQ